MRQYCSVCQYPLVTCVCSVVERVESPVRISIIQHPREVKHAKNTARLVALCIKQAKLIVSNDPVQMESLRIRCRTRPTALLYPGEHSQSWENDITTEQEIAHIVLLDGSWRQAYASWQQFPWLQSLPAYHFTAAPDSAYSIRHTHDINHLSTLEAVAYALKSRFGKNVETLLKLQHSMQELWQGPQTHRR